MDIFFSFLSGNLSHDKQTIQSISLTYDLVMLFSVTFLHFLFMASLLALYNSTIEWGSKRFNNEK